MGLIDEAAQAPGPLAASLAAGTVALSRNQTITFKQYTKVVLSEDGYVFWVANGITDDFKGSLHYITDRQQNEDETLAANRFIFTALEEITALNAVSPTTMWIGTWTVDGTSIQIAFSDRGSFYEQANLWHYSGYAVYPALASQLVNSTADLPVEPIVSNSLPIWLAQNSVAPVYPSFLVPDNVTPPYIVAHIEPQRTEALGSFPIYVWPGTTESGTGASPLHSLPSSQLMRDEVRLTLYGLTNQQAIQYYVSLMEYSLATDDFGFCNSPAIQDDKRTQVEIAAIAMKKTINILASYYQGTADAIARRLILSATVTTTPQAA
jgi:predicted nucleic acid-binding Zn ribbon protein